MDSTTIAESKTETQAEREIRSFLEGAETGMIELRGYGLSEDERIEAEALADGLYGEPEIIAATS